MKKTYLIVVFIVLGILATALGILLMDANSVFSKDRIEIIDATYSCGNTAEKFYEDDNYTYYFPCQKSSSIYVKYANGNKELVTSALENNKVTIKQLEDAGMKFFKYEK